MIPSCCTELNGFQTVAKRATIPLGKGMPLRS
jgi:hypothetical protein